MRVNTQIQEKELSGKTCGAEMGGWAMGPIFQFLFHFYIVSLFFG